MRIKRVAPFLRLTMFLAVGTPWLLLAATAQTVYENYTFINFAGPPETPGWHDGNGSEARFAGPHKVTVDHSGNAYVADYVNHTIRRITSGGVVTTVAGLAGSAGTNDGTGSTARFNNPSAVAIDGAGNLYVTDFGNHTIRKITPSGQVTTLAGMGGSVGSANGTGRAARFNNPVGITVDNSGNLYVADSGNHTIRKITPAGVVTTLAGLANSPGSANGTGQTARFNYPFGVTLDNNGNLFVADLGNHTIRKITPAGAVTTWAGNAGSSGNVDGAAGTARFYQPFDLVVNGEGILFVADTYNHTLRKITATGMVTTLAGNAGSSGSADGIGNTARFNFPTGLGIDDSGNLYVADYSNDSIRKVSPFGAVTVLAGKAGGFGNTDGAASAARFKYPAGVALDDGGNVYLADLANQTIRKITAAGVVSTLAGLSGTSGSADGTGSSARFNNPFGVAVDKDGNVYVGDTFNHTIRKITPDGMVTTLAGLASTSGSADGTGISGRFNNPFGVAVDNDGNVYVSDTWNHTIRKIAPDGTVTTLAGAPGSVGHADGTGSAARFNLPEAVAVDPAGNLYVADTGNSTIRKITPAGEVTTLAGLALTSGSADGTGNAARFYYPLGVTVDSLGNLYVVDNGNHTIRKITASGEVTTLAGLPGLVGSADGTGSDARFSTPEGIAVDNLGNLYVTDASNHAIRKGYRALPDSPRVDLPVAKVGVLRHLSVTNLTTTSWSWKIIRYPAGSSAQLSSALISDPTFTPDVPDLFILRFEGTDSSGRIALGTVSIVAGPAITPLVVQIHGKGTVTPNFNGQLLEIGKTYTMTAKAGTGSAFSSWTGSLATNSPTLAFVMQSNLTLTANFVDGMKPALTLSSPRAGQRWSNAVFTAAGTAKDNFQVAKVWYQLNSNAWSQASGTTHWTAAVSLTPGSNRLLAYAEDSDGNVSATNKVSFTYVLSDRLTLGISGQGALSPNYSNALLELGKSFTITARPGVGSIFAGWTGDVVSSNPKIIFVMQSNLVLQANFIPNPFLPVAGTYEGLFYETNVVRHQSSGFFSARVTGKGTFSGKLQLAGKSHSLSGQFLATGSFSNSIVRRGLNPIAIQLQLDLTGGEILTGRLSDGIWMAELAAHRNVHSKTNPPSQTGKYTLIIPGSEDSSTQPGGDGFGTVTIDPLGNVQFSGTLGDGTKVSQRTVLSKSGQWPLYTSLYAGNGSILGWLAFTNQLTDDISGPVSWIKLPPSTGKFYPAGFTCETEVMGSAYSYTKGIPILNFSTGQVLLANGNLSQNFTNQILFQTNKIINLSSNKLTLTLTASSGLFKGSVLNPVTLRSIPFNGVVLQKQNFGSGHFLGTNQSGKVSFLPTP